MTQPPPVATSPSPSTILESPSPQTSPIGGRIYTFLAESVNGYATKMQKHLSLATLAACVYFVARGIFMKDAYLITGFSFIAFQSIVSYISGYSNRSQEAQIASLEVNNKSQQASLVKKDKEVADLGDRIEALLKESQDTRRKYTAKPKEEQDEIDRLLPLRETLTKEIQELEQKNSTALIVYNDLLEKLAHMEKRVGELLSNLQFFYNFIQHAKENVEQQPNSPASDDEQYVDALPQTPGPKAS